VRPTARTAPTGGNHSMARRRNTRPGQSTMC